MRLFAPLFAAALAVPTPTAAQLYREADGNVVLRSGPTAIRFHWRFGGAVLQAYRDGFPPLLHESPGAAWQAYVRTGGNDPTESGPNGIMEFPVARLDDPLTWRFSYFGRETVFDTAQAAYEHVGFMPDFWLSAEAADDSIAPNTDASDSGWRTPYQPGGLASTLALPARPVVFEGSSSNFAGMFFVGDERNEGSPWAERLREYPSGRVAFKVTVSLASAPSTAFAGVVFRKSVPREARSKHDAWRAPGLALVVNKVGGWALTRTNPAGGEQTLASSTLTGAQRARLEGPGGLQIEARTHNAIPGYVEVWIDDTFVTWVIDDLHLAGPHVGLLANSSSGQVFFQCRMVVDVGIEVVSRYTPWAGGIVSDVTVRNAPGVTEARAYDRANLPAVFLNHATFPEADRRIARVFHEAGQYRLEDVVAQSYPIADQFGWWAGNSAGTAGVLAIPEVVTVDGAPSPGAHVFVKKRTEGNEFVLMLNPLAPETVTEAREMRFRTRWSTSLFDPK